MSEKDSGRFITRRQIMDTPYSSINNHSINNSGNFTIQLPTKEVIRNFS